MTVDEWDYRALCSDGGCTGVIGPNGQCKVCGRAAQNWGDERKRGMRNPTAPQPVAADADEPSDVPTELAPASPAKIGAAATGWTSRQLCSDGGCIGVVGAGGVCKVCGKAAGAVVAKAIAADGSGDIETDAPADDDEYEDDDAEETGDEEDADDVQAEDGEDDEGDGDDDDDDADDDDEDDESDDDEEDEPDDEEGTDSIHASASAAIVVGTGVAVGPSVATSEDEPIERELCPDGACVGVIGTDGRCKVCKRTKAEASA
ncbi:MAG TPA: hypothetical protein VGM90_38640 [Kofleriaceae bacterium]|jgi:hypothetical protein